MEELNFFQRLKTVLPANVALVMPDDKVSTYALIDRTDLGLVYGSTVALEMACRGKKVLLAARSQWLFCSAIEFIEDAKYLCGTAQRTRARTLSPAEAEQTAIAAYRFAYAYIFRWKSHSRWCTCPTFTVVS